MTAEALLFTTPTDLDSCSRILRNVLTPTFEEAEEQRENRETVTGVVNWMVKQYHQKTSELKKLFGQGTGRSKDPYVRGAATAAYAMITRDYDVIRREPYGGLGIKTTQTKQKLAFDKNQLWFAHIGGTALRKATVTGQALKYARISGDGMQEAQTAGYTLEAASIIEKALQKSQNSQSALASATIGGHALATSKNIDGVLCDAIIGGNSMGNSINLDDTLWRASIINTEVLANAKIGVRSLEDATGSVDRLKTRRLGKEKSFSF